MAALSEWLQIMLGEIARKKEDLERASEEEAKREIEKSERTHQPQPDPRVAQR